MTRFVTRFLYVLNSKFVLVEGRTPNAINTFGAISTEYSMLDYMIVGWSIEYLTGSGDIYWTSNHKLTEVTIQDNVLNIYVEIQNFTNRPVRVLLMKL